MRRENRNVGNNLNGLCNKQFPIWLNEILQQVPVTTLISVYVGSETSGLKSFEIPQYNHYVLQVFDKCSSLNCDTIRFITL